MNRLIPIAAVLAITAVAHAEPQRYLQVDGIVGIAAPVTGGNAMLGVEGGLHIPNGADVPVWAHAELAYGLAGDDQGHGTNAQARGGVELRFCSSGRRLCGVPGLDLGLQHGKWTSTDGMSREFVNALVAIPRAIVDLGLADRLRLRLGAEVDAALVGGNTGSGGVEILGHRSLIGLELFTGIAREW